VYYARPCTSASAHLRPHLFPSLSPASLLPPPNMCSLPDVPQVRLEEAERELAGARARLDMAKREALAQGVALPTQYVPAPGGGEVKGRGRE